MANLTSLTSTFASEATRRIAEAVQGASDEVRERCIKKAVEDYEAELRVVMTRAAVNIDRYFNVESHGQSLVITVRDARGL